MKIDNASRAGLIKLIYMLVPLLVVAAVAVTYLVYDIKDLRYMVVAFVTLLLFFLIMAIFRFNYIIFYADPDKIIVRYKGLTPFKSASNSVQIKTEEFKNYELKTSFFGVKKILYLYLESPSGLAKYPGIGFSGLKNDEIVKIKKALDLILSINKSNLKK